MYDIFVIGNNPNWKKIKSKYPFAKKVSDFKEAKSKAITPMFWTVWDDIDIQEDFDFTLSVPKWDEEYVHVWKNDHYFDGLSLIPKHKPISDKEVKYRFFTNKKEIDYVASKPKKYDIFEIETYEQYLEAMEKSTTDMFWMTSPNLKVADDFNFDLYITHHNAYERQENHVFVHLVNGEKFYNGVFLLSKHKPVSRKEIEHRHIIERKEWDIVASGPCVYDKFVVNTYEQYLEARVNSRTEMFWIVPSGVSVLDDFKFDLYFEHYNDYDRNIVHLFQNSGFYDGVMLVPKNLEISKKEFDAGFVVNRKEHDVMASVPVKFDKFNINTYEDYLDACEKSTTGMFWAIWPDVEVVEDFEFDYYVPKYNQHITYVFKNGNYFDGICLLSKYHRVNEKEFKYRFFSEKKEIDYVISYPKKYDIFEIETYEQYLEAMEKSSTDLFWATSPNLKVADDFNFDLYITYHNVYERQENHVFIHQVDDQKLYNGIFLLSKNTPVSRKEIEHRHIIERKEWDIIASGPCVYDKFVVDTYQQYLEAKSMSKTEMFWIVPSCVSVLDDFEFNLYFDHYNNYDRNINHVFRNSEFYDGVMLTSKSVEISKKEFDAGFVVNCKEHDVMASVPLKFEKFNITTYQDYLDACQKSKTNMFWAIWPDVEVVEDFEFDYYVPRYNQHITYVFKNGKYFDGVCLFSKYHQVSEREFNHRFFTEKKEIDYVVSYPKKCDIFEIETYEQYLEAMEKSTTDMFWMTSPNLKIVEDFDFSFQGSRYENHAFVHLVNEEKLYNGVFLLSKHQPVTKKEIEYRYLFDKKEWDIVASEPCQYDKFIVDNYEQYLNAVSTSRTEMFWMIPSDVEVLDDFKFDIYYSHDKEFERTTHHAFFNNIFYDGIFLVSKRKEISKKEIDNKFIVERKETEIVASLPIKFEKFNITTYQDYLDACEKSTTGMFWAIWSDVEVVNDFDFEYYVPRYNQHITHVFKNGNHFDGICLFSKNNKVSEKEFNHRFFTEKKEVDFVISHPKKYDKFIVDNYDDYLKAKEKSTTGMFYMIPSDVNVLDTFKFDLYFSHHNSYERNENHAFLNGNYYDGIFLVSKYKEISQKEIDNKFIIERKDTEILASTPVKFDVFHISTYQEYLDAKEQSSTSMFWAIWPDVEVVEDFDFEYYVPRYNQHITHVFKNDTHFDGVCLFSKRATVTEKEFKYRFFSEKKEIDYVISYPKKYDIFEVNTYKQYLEAMDKSKTELFWMIPSEVEPLDTFDFSLYFSHHNTYERRTNHSFKHLFRGEENFNGICLMSKHVPVSEKEINYRYLVERKEWDTVASKMKPYDIVFISYNEINADENFERVKSKYPLVKRVHGVKGIHQAHIKAAEQATTDNFWVVDGDAVIVDDFNFDYEIPVWERDTVHVWRSQNPINNLVYGYGGVKLLPRQLTLDMDVTRPDMTTSISNKFKPVQVISNVTSFNTDEFSTWKSAFRECAKLAGKTIDRQVDAETEERLNVWCTQGADKPYGEFAIKGALAGRNFATENPQDLFKINDFDWLYEQFLNEKNSSK